MAGLTQFPLVIVTKTRASRFRLLRHNAKKVKKTERLLRHNTKKVMKKKRPRATQTTGPRDIGFATMDYKMQEHPRSAPAPAQNLGEDAVERRLKACKQWFEDGVIDEAAYKNAVMKLLCNVTTHSPE